MNRKLGITEEKISELEKIVTETIHNKTDRESVE